GALTDVREQVVAVVAKERRPFMIIGGDEDVRAAAVRDAVRLDAHAAHGFALVVGGGARKHAAGLELAVTQVAVMEVGNFVVADEDVLLAVAVEVENHHAEGLAVRLDARLLADVGEGAIAVVAEEHARVAAEFLRAARVAQWR